MKVQCPCCESFYNITPKFSINETVTYLSIYDNIPVRIKDIRVVSGVFNRNIIQYETQEYPGVWLGEGELSK